MKTLVLFLALLFVIAPAAWAQPSTSTMPSPVAATSTQTRLDGFEQRKQLQARSLVANVPLHNIGPTIMSGRVVDVDVNPDDPTHMYIAYASGGLWKTTNNGLSFEPIFDDQASMTLGDIAVDWAHGETIWVGTGENNSSRSSYAGTGLYKSTDGGTTWQHLGLAATQRTGRIVLHPNDPNTVWVAALGALYSPGEDRGVYKTTDGGATWRKTLFVDDNSGAIDLVADPNAPDVLYAATWHRERRAWNFVEGGSGSGIYKSTDGGETWKLITGEGSGFPASGEGVGRIGLALQPGNSNLLYALLDNQYRRPEDEEEEQPALTRDMLRDMSKAAFLELDEEDVESYLRENRFPSEHTGPSIIEMVRNDEIEPVALVWFVEDANRELFDTPVIGAEVYRSDDGGATWQKTHNDYIDGVYFSYGYYFGQIRVSPLDPDKIYIMGVPILRSDDGGKTFVTINEENVHVDHHALWVSANRPGHLVNGNDGGLNISYDDGATWFKANTPSVGQFYAVEVDDARSYRVYGGLQDNGVWYGPHTYAHNYSWYGSGDYSYDRLLGGDGMQVQVDTRTNDIIYTGFQFGNYFRINTTTGDRGAIKPNHELGERPLRFNWQSPIHLSRHNQDILYFGSNKLHRSFNRGDDWETISGDLTRGGQPGDVPYGTLATIDESPLAFGLIYVGSDDGLVHVTRDGGNTWTRISDALPQDRWVSRVEASQHAKERVYVTLNGYRWDDFAAYVYRSDDYGQTWQRFGEDLPAEPVNVIVEDPENEEVLYVGTDHALYVSIDGGQSFMDMGNGIPNAPVHDLKVQVRAKHLIVGTHGRSIYRADVAHIQQLTPEMLARPLYVFAIDPVTHRSFWGNSSVSWREPTVPDVSIPYVAAASGEAAIRIKAEDGTLLKAFTDEAERGLNYAPYNLSAEADHAGAFNEKQEAEEATLMEAADNDVFYLIPGTYTVEITLNGETVSGTLEVREPRRGNRPEPRMGPSEEEEVK
ncbi:MAG: WD40/YVTN/BNR-like repeat-containing protein [Rhodothermales bacterium]